jgi:hypothetical protein
MPEMTDDVRHALSALERRLKSLEDRALAAAQAEVTAAIGRVDEGVAEAHRLIGGIETGLKETLAGIADAVHQRADTLEGHVVRVLGRPRAAGIAGIAFGLVVGIAGAIAALSFFAR